MELYMGDDEIEQELRNLEIEDGAQMAGVANNDAAAIADVAQVNEVNIPREVPMEVGGVFGNNLGQQLPVEAQGVELEGENPPVAAGQGQNPPVIAAQGQNPNVAAVQDQNPDFRQNGENINPVRRRRGTRAGRNQRRRRVNPYEQGMQDMCYMLASLTAASTRRTRDCLLENNRRM